MADRNFPLDQLRDPPFFPILLEAQAGAWGRLGKRRHGFLRPFAKLKSSRVPLSASVGARLLFKALARPVKSNWHQPGAVQGVALLFSLAGTGASNHFRFALGRSHGPPLFLVLPRCSVAFPRCSVAFPPNQEAIASPNQEATTCPGGHSEVGCRLLRGCGRPQAATSLPTCLSEPGSRILVWRKPRRGLHHDGSLPPHAPNLNPEPLPHLQQISHFFAYVAGRRRASVFCR